MKDDLAGLAKCGTFMNGKNHVHRVVGPNCILPRRISAVCQQNVRTSFMEPVKGGSHP